MSESMGKTSAELRSELERLRLEIQAREAEQGAEQNDGVEEIHGLAHPEDFTVRHQVLNYTNGDTYEGEILGNLRHGIGTHRCATGDVYQGDWLYDRREGKGKVTFPNGRAYDGEWREDKAKGQGTARYENGGVYVGEFDEDHRWGWGTHYFADGSKYEGEWVDDKITGQGRITYADGSYFEGAWEDGARVQGGFVAAGAASEYVGQWRGNTRHGKGTQHVAGQYVYIGDWEGDLQHGQGECKYTGGIVYDGQWHQGMRQGQGTLSAGDFKYEGCWQADAQHGEGRAVFDNGDRYVGNWQHGKRHGRGRCIFANGDKYDGEWAEGVRCSGGVCVLANGDQYQGQWRDDKRYGYGVCKFADGVKFRGEWEADCWVQSPAEPRHCRVAGPGVTRATAGQQAALVIQARDQKKCKRLNGGDAFTVRLTGPAVLTASVADHDDGTYEVSYTATTAGVYELSITLGESEHVADSPYPLRVLPGKPALRNCMTEGPGRAKAVCGEQACFSVVVYDDFGNRWFGADLDKHFPIEVLLMCHSDACPVSVSPTRDGKYTCSYVPLRAGFYRLHVNSRGTPLPRTPLSVQVRGNNAMDADPLVEVIQPIPDQAKLWEEIAKAEYAADGVVDGWDDAAKDTDTAEEKYIKAHPDVPVVENLEDMWKVSKLQRERKARQEADKRKQVEKLKGSLQAAFGVPEPSAAEVAQAAFEKTAAMARSDAGVETPPVVERAARPAGSSVSQEVLAEGDATADGSPREGRAAALPASSVDHAPAIVSDVPAGGNIKPKKLVDVRLYDGAGDRFMEAQANFSLKGKQGSVTVQKRLPPVESLKSVVAALDEMD